MSNAYREDGSEKWRDFRNQTSRHAVHMRFSRGDGERVERRPGFLEAISPLEKYNCRLAKPLSETRQAGEHCSMSKVRRSRVLFKLIEHECVRKMQNVFHENTRIMISRFIMQMQI